MHFLFQQFMTQEEAHASREKAHTMFTLPLLYHCDCMLYNGEMVDAAHSVASIVLFRRTMPERSQDMRSPFFTLVEPACGSREFR